MLKSSLAFELYAHFVGHDVTDRHVLPVGWSQSICIAADHVRIWCDPVPDFLNSAHGIYMMAISDKTCLLTRQYTDACRDNFAVAASLDQVVTMLLMDSSHKVGVAVARLLGRLEKQGLLKQTQVIGQI